MTFLFDQYNLNDVFVWIHVLFFRVFMRHAKVVSHFPYKFQASRPSVFIIIMIIT